MKAIWNTLVLVLALNFIAVAGVVGWLYQSHHLDKKRVTAIKAVLFPPPEPPATQPTETGPAAPSQRFADLLARHVGHTAAEQVEFAQQAIDTATAQLDRREREVADLESQVAAANAKLVQDRKTLEAERKKLTDQECAADKQATDKGFQDTLALYNTMAGKQVKGVFMSLDESAAAEYLDAMQPRIAVKILKEFKTADELERMKKILDKMRHPPSIAGFVPASAKE